MKYQSVIDTRDIPMMVLLGWTWAMGALFNSASSRASWVYNHRQSLLQRAFEDTAMLLSVLFDLMIMTVLLGSVVAHKWYDFVDYLETPGVLVNKGQALSPANFVLCQARRLGSVMWQTIESVAVNFSYGLDHIKQQLH